MTDKDEEATTYILVRDGERDLKFRGHLIAEADGFGASFELALYKTVGGLFILSMTSPYKQAEPCADDEEVISVLEKWDDGSLNKASKDLLKRAGIDAVEEIK